VHAKNFVINKSSDRHAVKHILEFLPDTNAVSALTLVVKSVNSIDLPTFVVTAKQKEVFFILELIGQQQNNCLKTLLTAVNVVTKEEIVGIRRESTVFKKPKKVHELSVYITYTK